MFFLPNSNLVMAQCPAEKCGIASSLMMTARNVGTVIGIAVFETVFSARVSMAGLSDGAVQGGSALAPLTLGFHDAFLVGAGFSILAVVLSVMAKDAGRGSEAASVRLILF